MHPPHRPLISAVLPPPHRTGRRTRRRSLRSLCGTAQKPGTSRDTLFHSFTIPTVHIEKLCFCMHRIRLHHTTQPASAPKEAPLLFPFRRKRFRRKNCTCIVMQSGTVRSHGEPSFKQYLARKHQLAVSQQLESETAPATLLSGNQIRGYETGEDSRNGWVVTGMCIREVRLQHTNQTTSTSFCGRWRGGTWMYCAGRSANKKSLRFLGGKHKEKRFKIKFTIVWPTRPPRHHTHPIIIVSGRNGRSLRASSVVNQLCNRTDRFIFKSSSLSYWCYV